MKSGLEEFLKRIEAKPTNETLIDRFMTLVLEEDGVERILYLKSLVGLLLKSNPYAALKAAYVELQEARKEKLSNEYEIGALKDVESCFINLGKTENAALVREEITKLQSDSPQAQAQALAKPAAPRPSQKPINDSFEFPVLPGDDENNGPAPQGMNAERTRMAESPAQQGHTSIDLARTVDAPSKRPFENKPIPTFPNDTKASAPAPANTPMPKQVPSPAPVQSQAPQVAPGRNTVPPQEPVENILQSDMFMPKPDSSKDAGFVGAGHDQTRASPINIPQNKPSSTSIPLESSFHADELVEPQPALVDADEADDFGFSFEYTKRTGIPGLTDEFSGMGNIGANGTLNRAAEPIPAASPRRTQTGFSLKDDIGDDYISAGSEIDEKFENQPFFQPDDDDEELPPAERTMLISLEKLNESKEQINLAATSSASVKDVNYPVNSGPNFVVLDSDDDDTATDLAPAEALPEPFDPMADSSALAHPFMSTAFDPDNALVESAYSPGSTHAPGASSAPFVFDAAAGEAPSAAPAPFVYEESPAPAPFVYEESPAPAPFVYEGTSDSSPAPFVFEQSPAPFVYEEAPAAVAVAVEMMPDLLAPTPLTSSSQAAHNTPSPASSPTKTVPNSTTVPPQAAASLPFNLEPDFMGMAPFQTVAPAAVASPSADGVVKVEVQPMPTAASPLSSSSFAAAPTAMEETVATGQRPAAAVKPAEPSESFKITPQPLHAPAPAKAVVEESDEDIDYRYKDEPAAHLANSPLDGDAGDDDRNDDDDRVKPLSLVPQVTSIQKWTLVQERLKLLSGLQIGRSHAVDFVKRLLLVKNENPVVIKTLSLLLQFVEAKLDKALCARMATWLFEELPPRAMHQLWESLNLKEEGLELYLLYVNELIKAHQHRRALSIMHDILRFDLDLTWYVESYPYLIKTWDKLGLEGWIWLAEEGGNVFCDRLARREDPLLATLLI